MQKGAFANMDYKRGAIIGANNTGKSYFMRQVIEHSYDLSTHKVLIVSESQSEVFKDIHRLKTYDDLRAFKSGLAIFYEHSGRPFEMLDKILAIIQEGEDNGKKYLQNGAIFFDDASNYITSADSNKTSVRTFLGTHRHRHLDLFFAAHTFTDFPSFLRRRMNYITVCKTTEYFENYKRFERLNYPNPQNIYKAWVEVMNSKDRYKKITIKTGQ